LEQFDVSPYVVALTEFLLADPLSYQLPRKYKIAFSGCSKDCAGTRVHDLGLVARKSGDKDDFTVYVGGGLGAHCRVADLLEEFVQAREVHFVAEAVKRVFDKHGNRKNKHKARLRFLIERIGLARFRELYQAELAEARKSAPAALPIRELAPVRRPIPELTGDAGEGFSDWRRANVKPQRQPGRSLVHIPLFLGDIAADRLADLAGVIEEHGEGMARATQWQNLVIRSVQENELPLLHRKLRELGFAEPVAPVLRNLVACAGASTCRLGICLSRGLAGAIRDEFIRAGLDLDKLGDLKIHVSGCPNSCGRHAIADIGLSGAARRVGDRLIPHYVLQLGGKSGEEDTRLAEGRWTLPARNVPRSLVAFLKAFLRSPEYPDYQAFLKARGTDLALGISKQYGEVPAYEEDAAYYCDWSAECPFSLAGRGPGECSAGVFDLIEVDLATARDSLQAGKLFAATALAARALFITQGVEVKNDAHALGLFADYFIDFGLVEQSHRALVEKALECVLVPRPEEAFEAESGQVQAFVEAVAKLYDTMDPSLRLHPAGHPKPECAVPADPPSPAVADIKTHREADLRGVTCPMNYVKTKLLLEQMATGEILSVALNEEGGRNVPQSAERDGHEVLQVTAEGDSWRVAIRKR
jgi:sulfite reductase (ferredoxin)